MCLMSMQLDRTLQSDDSNRKSCQKRKIKVCHNDILRKPKILLFLLRLTGTPIFDDKSKEKFSIENFLLKCFPIILHLKQVYILFAFSKTPIENEIIVPLIATSFLSVAIWHKVNWNRKSQRKIQIKFQKLEDRYKKGVKQNIFINIYMIVTILTSCVSCTVSVIFMPEARYDYRGYFNLYLNIEESSIIVKYMRTITCLLFFFILFFYPSVIAGLCCSVYHQTSNSWANLITEIRYLQKRFPNRIEMVRIFKKQRVLYKLTRSVESELSVIVFLVLCSQILSLFLALATFMTVSPKLMHCDIPDVAMRVADDHSNHRSGLNGDLRFENFRDGTGNEN